VLPADGSGLGLAVRIAMPESRVET